MQTILIATLVVGCLSIILFITNGKDEQALRIVIRVTAQIAVLLFSLTFITSGLHHIFNSAFTKKLMRYRPNLGLIFGVSHFIHLITLIYLQYAFHPVFSIAKSTSLLAGGVAYLFVLLMMITSFEKEEPKSRIWVIIHTVGSYWIWVIFFNSYLGNVLNKGRYHFFLALLVGAMMFKAYVKLKKGSSSDRDKL